MKLLLRSVAALEITLVLPAVLFMAALFLRSIQPVQYQPAHLAQQIVDWYAARPHLGLWILLIALPLLVTVTGITFLLRAWTRDNSFRASAISLFAILRAHASALIMLAATSIALIILAIVGFHVLTN